MTNSVDKSSLPRYSLRMDTTKIQRVNDEITKTNGRFFSIEFIKRTTGEHRKMNARVGVKKYLKGGNQSYDPASRGLRVVFDTQKREYRAVPLENVYRINNKYV